MLVWGAGRAAAHSPQRRVQRATVRRHLRRVCGPSISERELERRVDAVYVSYARYWAESLRLPSLPYATVAAGMTDEGIERIQGALVAGKGAILALPHLGGWEWGGTWLAGSGVPVSVVVERLQPPEVFEWFVDYRRRLGLEVIAVGPEAGPASLRALRANRVLCLLCDRVVGETPGIEVPFFGERTQLPAGPAALARRSGAVLLPAAVYLGRDADDHLAVVRPALEVPHTRSVRADILDTTTRLAGELETLIRRAPTQWHLLQPNWPSDPRVPSRIVA
jgi:phosphatidylinositol dimannoside acyltransferase